MSRNVHQFFRLSLVVLVAVILSFSSGERARFDNYRVYKVNADTETELVFLRSLDGSSDSLMFLDAIHSTGKDVHVVVAPHKVPDFLEALATNEIMYELVESNFQSVLEMDETPATETRATETEYNWKTYHQLDDTYAWMVTLARENPNVVTLIEGGKSYQGRSILGVKISFKNEKKEKPGIFVEAGMHAREWIGPAAATYIINQLLTSEDDAIKNLAQNFNWFVFPHTNPDGYVYTHTTNRLWRKTRTPYPRGCYGADPNRNWDFHWNEVGASSNPCSDTYAGPSAFSEIETETFSKFITSLGDQINAYLSFHSYSQLLLFPYGIDKVPDNIDDLSQVGNATIKALRKRYGTKYTGGSISSTLYPAAGGSIDWAYENAGIKMSYCFELRPSSSNFLTGFRLPPWQIIPTGKETLDGIGAMISEAKKLGYFN